MIQQKQRDSEMLSEAKFRHFLEDTKQIFERQNQ